MQKFQPRATRRQKFQPRATRKRDPLSYDHFRHLMGITSSISVASVLLKQKQKNILEHERILCFNKQTKNMQGSQEIFNPRFTLFLLAMLTELSLPCRNALCTLGTPCGCNMIHKCTDYIYILFSHSFYWSHDHRVYLLKMLMTFLLVWWTSWHFEWSRISWHFEYDEYVM